MNKRVTLYNNIIFHISLINPSISHHNVDGRLTEIYFYRIAQKNIYTKKNIIFFVKMWSLLVLIIYTNTMI